MLHTRLLNIVRRELESQNLQLSPYCENQIERMVGHAVQRMKIAKAADNPSYVMRAEQNLKSLIKYFSDYARDLGSHPKLGETDFDAALRSCPTFWPYSTST